MIETVNYHIINCGESNFLDSFLPGGYLGVGVRTSKITPQGISKACYTNYSMYADMKTIRKGDVIFVHAGQKIYGAFMAVTEFHEHPNTPKIFLSKNIHYTPSPENPKSGWKNLKKFPANNYYRCISIAPFVDSKGRNLCFKHGFDSNEVFELKLKKKVWSIPERWKYTDSARTVRPLTADEAWELIKILERENADDLKRQNAKSKKLSGYFPIEFILNPSIVTHEKIVEGWILNNIGKNKILDTALGPFSCFGNNMPAGYLKFMDIFGYQELSTGIRKYKVIEVKKENCVFPDHINQLIGYTDWVIQNIASGDYKAVEGMVIAREFNRDCIDFVKNFNTTGRKIRLISFEYVPPNYNVLKIIRKV